jgi:hypothetical protein
MVAIAKLPPAVRETADRSVAKANWFIAFHFPSKNGSRGFYRLAGRSPTRPGLLQCEVFENGEFVCVKYEVAPADLPPAVKAALERHAPGFAAKKIEAICIPAGKVSVYVFEGGAGASARTIVVRADGSRAVDYQS